MTKYFTWVKKITRIKKSPATFLFCFASFLSDFKTPTENKYFTCWNCQWIKWSNTFHHTVVCIDRKNTDICKKSQTLFTTKWRVFTDLSPRKRSCKNKCSAKITSTDVKPFWHVYRRKSLTAPSVNYLNDDCPHVEATVLGILPRKPAIQDEDQSPTIEQPITSAVWSSGLNA